MNEERIKKPSGEGKKVQTHGSKLKNEDSRRTHYRGKLRVGKDGASISVAEQKAIKKKLKQHKKQVRRQTAAADSVRINARSLAENYNDSEEKGTEEQVIDNAEDLAAGAAEAAINKVRKANYSRKLHEKVKKDAEQIENGKKGSNSVSKELQKKRMRREMQEAAAKKAKKEAANQTGSISKRFVDKAEDLAGRLAEWVIEAIEDHPGIAIAVIVFLILLMIVMTSLSSCSAISGGLTNATIATSYTAEDQTIRDVDNEYKDLESALQERINNIETTNPGYDEYQYDLDEIGHNSHSLAALLTVLSEDYTKEEAEAYLQSIFDKQYTLTLTPVTETRTRTETRTGHRTVHHSDGTTSRESYTYEVEVEYEWHILKVKLTNKQIADFISEMGLDDDQTERYGYLVATLGNKPGVFGDDIYSEPSTSSDYQDYQIPAEALTDQQFAKMIQEAEKYLGYPYVWGGSNPSTSFDCSGFVSYVINNCGNGWSVGRQTANGLYNLTTHVSASEAKPGDLIFFQGTYSTSGASHVGIYVGNGMMIHCGNPIQYASVETNYWRQHFLGYGRIQ